MAKTQSYFSLTDYLIFGGTLFLSCIIGIYHAIRHRKNTSSVEYLLASNTLPWFPIFVSMVASFFSAVGVLGFPAQVYATGIVFSLNVFSFIIPITLCAEIMTPLFRNLKLVSVNEYLELRFSRGTRYLGCLFFHVQYLLYLSIVLFAPSLALNSVAGVPMTVTILSTGLVCTMYTSLGGMRAVVWTDVFQSLLMMGGLITVTVIGVLKVGSINDVYEKALNMDRIHINFSPDPKVYHSFWGVIIGLTFPMFSVWSISQPTIQRVIAARSTKEAKKALYGSFVAIVIIVALFSTVALVIFATYSECDLVCSKQIQQNDQILPYFIMNDLGYLPGIPGLFTASIYSFSLSTISSGLNGMSALFLEDFAKKIKPDLGEVWALRISRIVACVGGIFITGFAFIVPKLSKYVIKMAIQFFGIIGGPYFAMFTLGIFTEQANAFGVYVGALIGFAVGMALSIGQIIYPTDWNLPKISIDGCDALNITLPDDACNVLPDNTEGSYGIAMVFSISYCWHGMIVILLSIAFGYTASLCTTSDRPLKKLLYNYNKSFLVKMFCFCCRRKNRKREMSRAKDNEKRLLSSSSAGGSASVRHHSKRRRHRKSREIREQRVEEYLEGNFPTMELKESPLIEKEDGGRRVEGKERTLRTNSV